MGRRAGIGEASIEGARKSVLRLLGDSAQLKNELTQVDEYLASVGRDTARIEGERAAAVADIQRIEGVREESAATLETG